MGKDIKIAQLLPRMKVGGVERGVYDLALFFKKSDISNIIVSSGGELAKELANKGITSYILPIHKKSILSLLLIPSVRKIFKTEKIDICHARSRVPGWVSFFASRKSDVSFVTTAHGLYKNRFFSEVMGWGKFVICPSQIVARHMKENFGVPPEKIVIINRWVDLEKFKFSDYGQKIKNNNIVSVGRISPSKGYEYLINGFRKVVRFNPYLKLKIVGSPDRSRQKYMDYLKTLVNRSSLNYNVQFVGYSSRIEDILSGARILVAPSVIEESFGRVAIEAFACGVPVVASKIGGFEEIIEDRVSGLLAEPRNPDSISEAIIEILSNPGLAETLVRNARKKVERDYGIEKCLEETKKVYIDSKEITRILVIKISSFGDIVLSIPTLKELRSRFKTGRISLLTSKKFASFFYDCPYLDEVISVDENYKRFKEIRSISRTIRRKSFDYIIDLQNNKTSHIISFLSFPRYSFGHNIRLGFLLHRRARYSREDSPLDSQEKVLQLLGIRFSEKKLTFWERGDFGRLELEGKKAIGIVLSASEKWESKNWPFKNIFGLVELIYKHLPSFKVVFLGDDYSSSLAERVEKAVWPKPLNLCGKTSLKDLPQVIKSMEVLVTPDTAILHLGIALGTPVVALFGPTDPAKHTVRDNKLTVMSEKLPCSFCYKPKCHLKEKNFCLTKISPQKVFSKIKKIVDSRP